jgi:hypothetical protein
MSLLIIITTLTVVLTLVAMIGAFVPVIPASGTVLIAALIQIIVLGAESGVSWMTILVLALLFALAQASDFACGMLGAKKYGAGKWGVLGAMIGAIVGIFFSIPGIILGPLIGALAFELIAGKELRDAATASWGTFLGTLLGLVVRVALTAAMGTWLLCDLFLFKPRVGQTKGMPAAEQQEETAPVTPGQIEG